MSSQQAMIAETIRGMKAALRKADNDYDSDSSTGQRTNRGNKLKRGARYMSGGRLDTTGGPAYRRRIEHAGYSRMILHDNPVRYDQDGDVVDDVDDDQQQPVAEPLIDNPYEEIKLDYLLAPLTSAAGLATHPSMAPAYTSTSLTELAERARQKLYRERDILAKLKPILQVLRGDALWAPLEDIETENDHLLLDRWDAEGEREPVSRTRHTNGIGTDSSAEMPDKWPKDMDTSKIETTADAPAMPADVKAAHGIKSTDMATQDTDAEMTDIAPDPDTLTNGHIGKTDEAMSNGEKNENNGTNTEETNGTHHRENNPGNDNDDTLSAQDQPSHAMTTRAKAKTPPTHEQSPDSGYNSPPHSLSLDDVDAWFLAPAATMSDRDFGLPMSEAEDTRRMLILYVQKQEEIVRGTEKLMMGLLQADRKRKQVWQWCKAEGHVGELSDGEDWYDKEELGLSADLVKGKEEEDVEDDGVRKGRRRRDARKP